jgi:thymidylate synthase ThyX
MPKELSIKLVSATRFPVETIYIEWVQSRTNDPVGTAEEVFEQAVNDSKLRAEIDEVFTKVIGMKLPLCETLDFVFVIENISIALREQLVRHRVGHKMGGRLGADLIPDLAGGSSFWSQSMRVKDMSRFVVDGDFYVPPSMESANSIKCSNFRGAGTRWETAPAHYARCLKHCESAYRKLVDAGVPPEDARMVIPLGATHRMSWKVNLGALQAVLSKRGCWIAQLGLWKPIIHGVVAELTKIHPSFRRLIDPPCFKDAHYTGCVYDLENWNRLHGEDPGVPCSLWCCNDGPGDYEKYEDRSATDIKKGIYEAMLKDYGVLWRRDPRTGEADDA